MNQLQLTTRSNHFNRLVDNVEVDEHVARLPVALWRKQQWTLQPAPDTSSLSIGRQVGLILLPEARSHNSS